MGRARAWLRIALMQKKLADYLQALMEHKDEALAEYYEPHALMMSEEVSWPSYFHCVQFTTQLTIFQGYCHPWNFGGIECD